MSLHIFLAIMNNLKSVFTRKGYAVLLCLWLFHDIVALWQFATSPFFEISFRYLSLCSLLFLWIVFNIILIVCEIKKVSWWLFIRGFLDKRTVRDVLFVVSFFFVLVRVALWYLRALLGQDLALHFGGYLDVLSPILNLIAYIFFEIILMIVVLNFSGPTEVNKVELQNFFSRFLFVFFVLIFLSIVIVRTGLGITSSYRGDWGRGLPAVPLLEWQIIFAGLLCFFVFFFEQTNRIFNVRYIDLCLCALIFLSTAVFWLSRPVIPNPSALTPHLPNFEIYPFIDSQTYDELAQSVLVGNGFGEEQIPQRPLYIVFLSIAHLIAGQDYGSVIIVQTLVFAFFPVLLFLFGKEFFGRPLGISIALLAALRDYTSNIVSPFTGNLTYSKVYLSEIPTAMLLILLLIIGIRWIRSEFPLFLGFLLGGLLGLAMLIRTQAIVVVPVILLFAILSPRVNFKALFKSTIYMMLMMMIVVGPWLWRNWKITGDFIFDNPESQTMNLALRYGRVNGVNGQVARLPGETSAEFSARLNRIAMDTILSNPSAAAWALTNSFMNHGVNNILLFPLRDEINSMDELMFPADAFWEKWEGTPTPSQKVVLSFYIFLFGFGVAFAWWRNGWMGLLPLGLNMAYNLWTSIALLSGQRFMVTMDWSVYFYYMVGLFGLMAVFLFTVNNARTLVVKWLDENPFVLPLPVEAARRPKFLFFGLLFFWIGLSLPLVESIFPERYPHLSQKQLIAFLSNSPALEDSSVNFACLNRLGDHLMIEQGRAVYPRYYIAGDGEDFTDTPGYKAVDKGRLVFDIVGQANHRVIFPMSQQPDFFPHASDVTLVYNSGGDIWFALVQANEKEKFYISDDFDRSLCDS